MVRLAIIILALLPFPFIALAQGNPNACPDILVTGPAGIIPPGQDALFTVDFRNLSDGPEPKFKWSVTGGEITSRQDERTMKVRFDGKTTVVATVEVLGLLKECPTTISETLSQCSPPIAVGLFRLQPENELLETEVDGIADNLKENPSDQLYIQSGYIRGKPTQAIEAKERNVGALLISRGISADRITFVGVFAERELMKFYRIPPGAENPPCEECETAERHSLNSKSPSVSVLGPPGVTLPGDSITFTVNAEIGDPEKFSYSWLVMGRETLEDQGKPWIRIATNQEDNGKTLKATVNVLELATQCVNTAEGEAIVQDGGDPPLIDEFGVLSDRELRQRLKYVASELKRWPNYRLYIISYTKPTERKIVSTRRQQRFRRILIENGVPSDDITTVDGGSLDNKVNIKFYAVPPKTQSKIIQAGQL